MKRINKVPTTFTSLGDEHDDEADTPIVSSSTSSSSSSSKFSPLTSSIHDTKKHVSLEVYTPPNEGGVFPFKEMGVLLLVGFSSALVLTGPFPYGNAFIPVYSSVGAHNTSCQSVCFTDSVILYNTIPKSCTD